MSLMLAEIAEQPAALERTIKREAARVNRFATSLKQRGIRFIVIAARAAVRTMPVPLGAICWKS